MLATLQAIFIPKPKQTEFVPNSQGKIHVIGVGGKGRLDVEFLTGKLPEGIGLFSMDQEPMQPINIWRHDLLSTAPTLLGEKDEAMPQVFSGIDTLLIVTGLGGQFGTNETLSLAKTAIAAKIEVCVFTTFPFAFEGRRITKAKKGLAMLEQIGATCRVQENDKLRSQLGGNALLNDAFTTQREWLADRLIALTTKGGNEQ